MAWRKFNKDDVPPWNPNKKDYTSRELDLLAEDLLRKDGRTEKCPQCEKKEIENFGKETGEFRITEQFDKDGAPIVDEEGHQLIVKFPEFICEENHKWFKGEGKAKGLKGKNPILFAEHLEQREKREIQNDLGYPDPAIKSGIYWRPMPGGGRPFNSPAERKALGLGFYK